MWFVELLVEASHLHHCTLHYLLLVLVLVLLPGCYNILHYIIIIYSIHLDLVVVVVGLLMILYIVAFNF